MPFKAKLKLDENSQASGHFTSHEYNVLDFSIAFNVSTDSRGFRQGRMSGGEINLLIESNKNGGFLAWISMNMTSDGEITFFKSDLDAPERKIIFQEGSCIHYSEEFAATGEMPMLTRITISARIIDIDDCEVDLFQHHQG